MPVWPNILRAGIFIWFTWADTSLKIWDPICMASVNLIARCRTSTLISPLLFFLLACLLGGIHRYFLFRLSKPPHNCASTFEKIDIVETGKTSDSVLLLSTRGCIDKTGWEQDGANWKLRHCSRRKLNFAENWDAPSDSSVCGYQPRHVRRLLLLPPPLHLPLLPLHPHHIIQLDATSQVSVLNLSNYPELPSKHLKRRSGLPACDSVSTTFWTENGNRERRPFRTRRTIGTTQLVCQKSIWLRWDSHMQAWECWSIRKFANQATGKCWFFYTANS